MYRDNVGKLVVVGDSCSGKTASLQTFISSGLKYPKKYNMTMGITPIVKEIRIPDCEDAVILLFYDSTGLDLYHGILTKYWEYPDMVLVVYDVTSATSFDHLSRWIELIKSIKWTNKAIQFPVASAIYANKTDLIERRVVSIEKGKEFANKHQMQYFEGSAKKNDGVNEIFQWFGQKWYNHSVLNG